MSADACGVDGGKELGRSVRYRTVLWWALWINAAMFGVEIWGGLRADSVSLHADAIDFAGDAANYAISLTVLSMGVGWKSGVAMLKGMAMAFFGVFVLGRVGWSVLYGVPPQPWTMGGVAMAALSANSVVALMLYAYREGDANMRSVWLCTRNDVLGSLAVMLAAAGVFGTGQGWPDLIVAAIMAALALSSALSVVRQARLEWAQR